MNAVLNWLVDGVVIATLASLVALVMPSNAPSQRYVYWWIVLAAIIGVPLLPASTIDVERAVGPMREVVASPVRDAVLSLPQASLPHMSPLVLWLVCALWTGFAVTRSLALVRSLQRIRQLIDGGFALPPEFVRRFRTFRAAQAGSRAVSLRVTTAFRGACAVGYRRPSILVSSALTERLSPEDVEAVVLHEYAHLQRYDDWACLAQAVIRAALGLHPAVWWAMRQLDIEREAACDRLVVQRTQAPVAYVRALTAAADLTLHSAGTMLHLAPGLTRSAGGFQSRMRRLIEAPIPNRTVTWGSAMSAVSALVVVVLLTDRMPPLVVVTADAVVTASEHRQLSTPTVSAFDVVVAPARPADKHAQSSDVSGSTLVRNVSATQREVPARRVVDTPVPKSVADAVSEPSPESDLESLAASVPTELAARDVTTSVAPLVERPQAIASVEQGIGGRAASIGAATGGLASHAGVSIGRFFTRGGRAVAQRFENDARFTR